MPYSITMYSTEWCGGRRVIPTFDIQAASGKQIILHNPELPELETALELTKTNKNGQN